MWTFSAGFVCTIEKDFFLESSLLFEMQNFVSGKHTGIKSYEKTE